jgi:hypothetical protein
MGYGKWEIESGIEQISTQWCYPISHFLHYVLTPVPLCNRYRA